MKESQIHPMPPSIQNHSEETRLLNDFPTYTYKIPEVIPLHFPAFSNIENAWNDQPEIYFDAIRSGCCGTYKLEYNFYNNESKSEVILKAQTILRYSCCCSPFDYPNNSIDLVLPSGEIIGSLFIYAQHVLTTMFLGEMYQGRLQFYIGGQYYADVFDKNERRLYTGESECCHCCCGCSCSLIGCCNTHLATMRYDEKGFPPAFSIYNIYECHCCDSTPCNTKIYKFKIVKNGNRFPGGMFYLLETALYYTFLEIY